jgi:hypothetical protein
MAQSYDLRVGFDEGAKFGIEWTEKQAAAPQRGPSDAEIEAAAREYDNDALLIVGFRGGAEWMREQMQRLSAPAGGAPSSVYPDEFRCDDCGDHHYLDCVIPSDLWNQIMPDGGAICAKCIDKRLTAAGLKAECRFYFVGESLVSYLYDDERESSPAGGFPPIDIPKPPVESVREAAARDGRVFDVAFRAGYHKGIEDITAGGTERVAAERAGGAVDLGDCEAEFIEFLRRDAPGDVPIQAMRIGFQGARKRIEARLHPTPPEPADPFEVFWEKEFARTWDGTRNAKGMARTIWKAGRAAADPPLDPRAAFRAEFGYDPANDDQLWTGWVRHAQTATRG